MPRSQVPSHEAAYARLRRAMRRDARTGTVPGVLLDVHGLGVLLEGPSGIGKSALALELVNRGHRLVADDVIEATALAEGVLVGQSPKLLRGHLEVRGVGILDLRKLIGARALRERVRIDLVVRMLRARGAAADRLRGRRGTRRILGVRIDRLDLNAGSRAVRNNLPGLVEAACLEQELRLLGLAGDHDFERRQARAIRKQT